MSIKTIDPDYLNVQRNKEIMGILSNEVVFFSDKIKLLSSFNLSKKRMIILTSASVYVFKQTGSKKKTLVKKSKEGEDPSLKEKLSDIYFEDLKWWIGLRKQIELKDIAALTKSTKSTQFIIHTLSDFIRFKSENANEWIDLIKIAFVSQQHQNLNIYAIDQKDLRGVTKIKKESVLLSDENLMKEEAKEKAEDFIDDITERSEETASDDGCDNPHVIETTEEFIEREYVSKRSSTLYSKESIDEVTFADFEIKQVLGIGSFGKVYLVENLKTGKLHAMKSIKQDTLIGNKNGQWTKLEEHILLNSEHPNIVSLDYVFKNEKRIYFVMNFVRGGELFKQIIDWRRFEESRAKFYAAQIALALGHLHSQDVLYRDLKPENILLGEDGYVYLTDFGLSRILARDEIANSFWGTPEYLAPEMINSSGHNFAIDWWALGILIYEMIVGIPPFYHKNRDHMFYLIKEASIKYPDPKKHGISVSQDAQDLINLLLDKEMDSRFGSKNDVDDILSHPWFEELDIDAILSKEAVPPYKPEFKNNKYDTSFFDPSVTWLTAKESE